MSRTELVEAMAVSGLLDPDQLPQRPFGAEVAELMCRRIRSANSDAWVMLEDRFRVEVLTRLLRREGRAALVAARSQDLPCLDTAHQRALDAIILAASEPLEELDEDELLAALDVWGWLTEAAARAGQSAALPINPTREQIDGRLAQLEVTRAVRKPAAGGCYGRDEELGRLHRYIGEPAADGGWGPESSLVVHGVGGVGKSTLMARFVMDLYENRQPTAATAWAYLDLDRPTLQHGRPAAVVRDIGDQLAAQFPHVKKITDRLHYNAERSVWGISTQEAHGEASGYVAELANIVRYAGVRSLIVVLDTLRVRPET